jgi:hypothetical protein
MSDRELTVRCWSPTTERSHHRPISDGWVTKHVIVRRFNLGLFRWICFLLFRFSLQNWSRIPNAKAYKRFGVFWGGPVGCQMGGTPINYRRLLLPHNRKLGFKCWNMSKNLVPCRHGLPLVQNKLWTFWSMSMTFWILCIVGCLLGSKHDKICQKNSL